VDEQTPIALLTDVVHDNEPLVQSIALGKAGTRSMVFVTYSATAAFATLISALAGILVQWLLTASYIAESRSMVSSVVGLVGTLVSVVIGLLVWTSYGLFNAQQSDLEVVGRSVARLHFALRQFGPQAVTAHAVLRKQALQVKARFWPDEQCAVRQDIVRIVVYKNIHADVQEMLAALAILHPTDQDQRESLAQMREIFARFVETQLSMLRNLANRVPNILLNVVVGWACVLFFGYGLLAGINALTLFMAVIGSLTVASSILMILEMSDPYTGLMQISSVTFDQLLYALTEQP